MNSALPQTEAGEARTRICVSIREESVEAMAAAIDRAIRFGADLVEIRLDHLPSDQVSTGSKLAHNLPLSIPPVLTLRPVEQRGRSPLDVESRIDAWQMVDTPRHALFDWELEIVEALAAINDGVMWERIICSYHDFGTPGEHLDQVFERMVATPAGRLKLAITAQDATDCFRIFDYLEDAANRGRKMVGVAMGPAGTMTRVLGAKYGSAWTYASLDDEHSTADGQLSIGTMEKTFRAKSVSAATISLGIIGKPVAHSLSPAIHNAALAEAGISGVFLPLLVDDPGQFLPALRSHSPKLNWRGLAVTAPHKQAVLSQLDRLDPAGAEIGAVNTIVIEDQKLYGYNTDSVGFLQPLRDRLIDLRRMRCAVLGAGGAARAVVWALMTSGADVTVFARDTSRAASLAKQFKVPVQELTNASLAGYDLVVNTTPLGTAGSQVIETPAKEEQLRGVQLVYDLVYNPESTQFLQEGERAGARTIGGFEMLLAQAAAQFKLWTGQEPDLEVMRTAATDKLNQ